VKDLSELAPGDLILTDKPAVQPVVLCVGEEKKFLGQIGQHRGKRAIRVLRPIEPTDRV